MPRLVLLAVMFDVNCSGELILPLLWIVDSQCPHFYSVRWGWMNDKNDLLAYC